MSIFLLNRRCVENEKYLFNEGSVEGVDIKIVRGAYGHDIAFPTKEIWNKKWHREEPDDWSKLDLTKVIGGSTWEDSPPTPWGIAREIIPLKIEKAGEYTKLSIHYTYMYSKNADKSSQNSLYYIGISDTNEGIAFYQSSPGGHRFSDCWLFGTEAGVKDNWLIMGDGEKRDILFEIDISNLSTGTYYIWSNLTYSGVLTPGAEVMIDKIWLSDDPIESEYYDVARSTPF